MVSISVFLDLILECISLLSISVYDLSHEPLV